jgi:heat shock protein HslJ
MAAMMPHFVLPLALLMTGCAGLSDSTSIEAIAGSWQYAQSELPMGTRIPTLRLARDGSISGGSGINRFTGAVDLNALARGEWRIGPLTGTEMAGTRPAMQFEVEFVRRMTRADRIRIHDGQLQLCERDAVVLAFVPVQVR